MKFLSWAIVVLGLWILLGAFMPGMILNIIAGALIAILALMGALKT
jgi:hypothetical protein